MKCLSLSNKSPDRNHRGARSAIFLQKLLISRKRKFFPILFFVLWIPLKICPVPTMHFSDRENGTVWRCIFELIKARFASLCSIKGMREPVSLFVSHKQSTKMRQNMLVKSFMVPVVVTRQRGHGCGGAFFFLSLRNGGLLFAADGSAFTCCFFFFSRFYDVKPSMPRRVGPCTGPLWIFFLCSKKDPKWKFWMCLIALTNSHFNEI